MNAWILIITVLTGAGAHTHHVRIGSAQACEQAKARYDQTVKSTTGGFIPSTVCVQEDLRTDSFLNPKPKP